MEAEKFRGAELRHYEKGEILIRQGDPVTHLYYLVKGTVFREVVTPDGYESVPSVKTAASKGLASLVGVLALFTGNENLISNSSFVTNSPCTCYKIPKESVMEYLKVNPDELVRVVELAMREHANLFQLLVMRNEGQVANRLCKLLMDRCVCENGRYLVTGQNTNVDLAKFLCVHKVTVARIIRQLKEEGVISKKGSVIRILKPDMMQEYADCRRQLKYF